MLKGLKEAGNLRGKKVFLRADFNVPLINNVIGDDFRIRKTFPAIDFLVESGARVILASHIEGEGASLKPVFDYLKEKYNVSFSEDFYPELPNEISELADGEILLLENLRKYEEETKNDEDFSRHLASFADFYVNEAFPVSHRKHASVVGIPKYIPGFAGIVFEDEVRNLSKAFSPSRPFLFILGGAKFDTKLPLVQKFFSIADFVFIGGALANDFLKAKGFDTGNSLLSSGKLDLKNFMNQKLILPVDMRVRNGGSVSVKRPEQVSDGDIIADIGPESVRLLKPFIKKAKFILWNGPLGNYELGFREATTEIANLLAQAEAETVVGGGDTIASISTLGAEDKFSFISTGGGAMLDFLANETLPGIEALNNSF